MKAINPTLITLDSPANASPVGALLTRKFDPSDHVKDSDVIIFICIPNIMHIIISLKCTLSKIKVTLWSKLVQKKQTIYWKTSFRSAYDGKDRQIALAYHKAGPRGEEMHCGAAYDRRLKLSCH
jgi:hypothetical protein